MRPCIAALVAAAALTAPAAAHAAVLPGQSIDGPSADIKSFGDVDVAPDGTGAIAYIKSDAGVDHVFVSRIANGAFGAPERADIGIADGVVEATASLRATAGKLVVVFLNPAWHRTCARSRQGSGQSFTQTQFTTGNTWISVDVDASPSGQATRPARENVGANGNVHAFRLDGTTWSQVGGGQLDNTGGQRGGRLDGAGPAAHRRDERRQRGRRLAEKTARPRSEVFARRLTGTTAGPDRDARRSRASTARPREHRRSWSTSTSTATGAAWVAFREDFAYGAQNRARILVRSLVGDAFEAAQVVDGLPEPDRRGRGAPADQRQRRRPGHRGHAPPADRARRGAPR